MTEAGIAMDPPIDSASPVSGLTQPFPRLEPTPVTQHRRRGSSLQNRVRPPNPAPIAVPPPNDLHKPDDEDFFEKPDAGLQEEASTNALGLLTSPNQTPEAFDELPIELLSLIDRFIESLTAKVYDTPPSIDKLSSIFQDFYTKASSHVATHISALSSQQARGASPHASISSRTSQTRQPPRSSSRDTLSSMNGQIPEQQMLTPQEIADRRKARRLLDQKGVGLEEAVERRVCERVYSRIWRHRSTLDEVRDEKLRSKTAALAVVGIGMKDLGVDLGTAKPTNEHTGDVDAWVSEARNGLLRMNDAKFPLGKLQQLAAAHKNIVDMLTAVHNASSSADEILPTLIYTLITSPPEGINVISNLQFIQRFRNCNKIDGEAAYCLTNLEAAIAFLEDVDLASLRSKEATNRQIVAQEESGLPPLTTTTSETAIQSAPQDSAKMEEGNVAEGVATNVTNDTQATLTEGLMTSSSAKTTSPSGPLHRRRVSNIFQPPAAALGAAGDAVRNTADQSLKGIGTALDNSFNLLFGRLGEQKIASPNPDKSASLEVPKTLDDARKLIEPKSADEESLSSEVPALSDSPGAMVSSKSDDNVLSAIAGRKQPLRDRSTDSNRSGKAAANEIAAGGNAAMESMRNFGSSINPLKGFGGMNMIRGFGRTSSSGTPTISTIHTAQDASAAPISQRNRSTSRTFEGDIKTLPPIQRFLDAPDAQSLRISDIPALLEDYKRLAQALKTMEAV